MACFEHDKNSNKKKNSTFQGHSTTELLTKRQLRLIINLCAEKRLFVNDLALKICKKQIHDCSMANAHELIKYLQSYN